MDEITGTRLWNKSLGLKPIDDPAKVALERLRVCFIQFRERAGFVANEIHRDLPEFTVHDITHLDALWEIGDIIAGEDFTLTPTEAFVLGGAFLLHDLGMGLAAYPQGIEDLKKRETWNDTITLQFIEKHHRQPTPAELASPSHEAVTSAMTYLLRALHAEQAERLGLIAWSFPGTGSPQYLIDDTDIRQTFGRIIGLIAHSHWWPVHELEGKFPRTLGAPHWCPKEWTVDPLKLACLLRLSDACHIDGRRAPSFLRTIRRITAPSSHHWAFQQRLSKPHLSGDALSYTSGHAFNFDESAPWWLCYDTLQMIDEELRAVDTLCADKGLQRFSARRIAGIESSERLTSYIPTAGWKPVDASIQVSDVPRLLSSLGGKELYGRNPQVPIRELIQNGSDALRARWAVEKRPTGWGQISVTLGQEDNKHWIEVEDNGIGMSARVLTKHLLDFSSTFWGSTAMIDELPGLLGSGFRPTGKYGIGFFSVFMMGDSVKIRTRRADAAQKDTLVLEFNTGLSSRPILREAACDEVLRDGGTCIRVWLRVAPTEVGGILHQFRDQPPITLSQLCKEIAPASPVTLVCNDSGEPVIKADDWLECPGEELFSRAHDWYDDDDEMVDDDAHEEFFRTAASNLKILRDQSGVPVGRACIGISGGMTRSKNRSASLRGTVAIGGLAACNLHGIAGILVGVPERAARDTSTPVVSAETLSAWASEQASLVPLLYKDPIRQMECASTILRCGGDTLDLPIAKYNGIYVSYEQITRISFPNEIYLISPFFIEEYEKLPGFQLRPEVIVTEIGSWISIISSERHSNWPDELFIDKRDTFSIRTTLGGRVLGAVAKAWGTPYEKLLIQDKEMGRKRIERVIGHLNSEPVTQTVYAFHRE